MRMLGIDPGTKRIGLALADEETRIALPHRTLERTRLDGAVEEIVRIIAEQSISTVIIGHPLRLDGTRGISARRAEAFAQRIEDATQIPVHLWDERFTSEAAAAGMRQAGVRGRRGREVIDQAAAALILQSYLDAHG